MTVDLDTLLEFKGAAVMLWIGALFLIERLAPRAVNAPLGAAGWRRIARNGGLFAVNFGLSLLVVLPVSVWAASHGLGWRPGWWSGWLGLALDVLLLDFWIYWWHRANHGVPFLWRFHEIHHLDNFLDTTSAVRFHFAEVLLSAAVRAVVIILAGIPIMSVLVFETLVLVAAIFHHSNIRLAPAIERPLSWVVITPALHWMHHHAVRVDTDSNYGTMLSVWDRLFGSKCRHGRTDDMAIGVEGEQDRTLGPLLARPFLPHGRIS